MTTPRETDKPRKPQDFDAGTGDRVEKKPKGDESPQQTHNDEDQG
jgi:hypothetical protein